MSTRRAYSPASAAGRVPEAGSNPMLPARFLGLLCLLFLLIPMLLSAQDRNIGVNEVYPAPMFMENGGRFINVQKLVEAGIYHTNVKGDGVTDDSDAIIAAMDSIMNRLRDAGAPCGWDESWPIYFPDGTYLVSKPLIYAGEIIKDCAGVIREGREGTAGLKLIGQSREGVIIRLKDNAQGFGDVTSKKPVVAFSKITSVFNNAPAGFHFRNFTISTGSGNPGAIGLDYYGANTSRLDNVKIIGGGEIGLHIRMGSAHGYYSNLTINGFMYGIKLEGNTESHPSIEYVSLSGQTVSAIDMEEISASFRKIHSTNLVNGIKIHLQANDVRAPHMVMVDSYFLGGSSANTAIDIVDGVFFGRNITVQGYGTTARKKGQVVQDSGSVEEYNSEAITTFSNSRVRNTAIKSMNLPIEDYPIIPWISDFSQWANVEEYGAVGGGLTIDSEAIQRAMNSGKPVIYFPKMKYRLNNVQIPATVKQIIGGDVLITNSGVKFDVNASSSDVLLFRDLEMNNGGNIRHSAHRDILLESASSSGNPYKSDLTTPGSKIFANNVHGFARSAGSIENISAWARYINNEKVGDFQFNVGVNGTLWILGLKSEKVWSVFGATNGGKLEVLGGVLNRFGTPPADRTTVSHPAIVNDNSHVSVIVATNGPRDRSWVPMVKDTVAGTAKTWTMDQFPNRGWDANIIVPLYASYDPAALTQAALPVTIVDLKANEEQGKVKINWSVAQETNIDQYEVQHSSNGVQFSTIQTIKAKNSSTTTNYSVVDTAPLKGTNYYRLLVNERGRTAISKIVSIKIAMTTARVAAYTVGNKLNLKLNGLAAGTYTLSIVNSNGQLLQNTALQHNGLDAIRQVKLKSNFSKGVYRAVLQSGSEKFTEGFIIQ